MMIIRDYQPVSIVDDTTFNNLLKYLFPEYVIPSRRTMDTIIDKFSEKIVKMIKKELENTSYVTLTTDYWSGLDQNSILNIYCSFFNDIFNKVNLFIGAKTVNITHTAETTIDEIYKLLNY